MLIFTIDSLVPIFTLFENKISVENNTLFFNDGTQLRKVISYNPIEQQIGVDGMSEPPVIGYTINLVDGIELSLQIKGDSIEVSPLNIMSKTTYDFGINNKVSKYLF